MDSERGIDPDNTVEVAETSRTRHALSVEESSLVIHEGTQQGVDMTLRFQT